MTDDRWKRPISWQSAAVIAILAAIWLVMLLGGTGQYDQAVDRALYVGREPALVEFARVLTALGEPTMLIGASILCSLWLWSVGRGRLGLALLLVALLGRGLSELQKILVDRPRPTLETHLVMVKSASFPSGHAMSSMVFYLALAMALAGHSRWRNATLAAAVLLSLLIGTSRIMLGVHWPSDVVGGWAVGAAWVLLALRPVERLVRADTPAP